MRTPYQLCRPSFRCFMVAAALLLLWSMPALVLPQEGKIKIGTESRAREITRERERYKASHPWVTEQQLDIVQWRFEHPGSSTEDYWNWKRNGHLPDHNHAPSNSAALDSRTTSQDELLAAVRQTGATLLKPADARGWGYVGYTRGNLSDPRSEEVRFSPGKDNPARVEKFLLVDNPFLFLAKGSDFTHQNTIEIPLGEHLTGQDLTRFYQVNNRFLRDVPFSTPASANSLPSLPKIENSNAMVITGARLANGEEVLTIFSLADLDRKSTRLNSSHLVISYAVFCLKKKRGPHRSAYPGQHLSPSPSTVSRALPGKRFFDVYDMIKFCFISFFF